MTSQLIAERIGYNDKAELYVRRFDSWSCRITVHAYSRVPTMEEFCDHEVLLAVVLNTNQTSLVSKRDNIFISVQILISYFRTSKSSKKNSKYFLLSFSLFALYMLLTNPAHPELIFRFSTFKGRFTTFHSVFKSEPVVHHLALCLAPKYATHPLSRFLHFEHYRTRLYEIVHSSLGKSFVYSNNFKMSLYTSLKTGKS